MYTCFWLFTHKRSESISDQKYFSSIILANFAKVNYFFAVSHLSFFQLYKNSCKSEERHSLQTVLASKYTRRFIIDSK